MTRMSFVHSVLRFPSLSATTTKRRCFALIPNWVDEVIQKSIERGELRSDLAQKRAAIRLTKLQKALVGYSNDTVIREIKQKHRREKQHEGFPKAEAKEEQIGLSYTQTRVPRGLYIYGQVGTGKSMLMDTFYREAPIEKKRRVHFHAFLQEVHQRIFALKQKDLKERGRSFHIDTSDAHNSILRVAEDFADEITLLCFDEFQVTDVADALILSQFFATLFQRGTVVIATSNRPPSDLYEGGINRSYFLPFIALLERHCIVHELKSEVDYRMLIANETDSFFLVDPKLNVKEKVDEMFVALLNGRVPISHELVVSATRVLKVKQSDPEGLVGRFRFSELCQADLGASDYRVLAQHYDVVILEDIPILNLKEHDQARRFITLIDELYEHNCVLFCSAVQDPHHLFINSSKIEPEVESIEIVVGERFGIDVSQSSGRTIGELASVRELSFAFRRAASRLMEMCSKNRWDVVLSHKG